MVPEQVARAIDRLSRRAHRFHRFAHHPLCREYAGELLRVGRRGRVCRGCASAACGAAAGLAAGAVIPVGTPHVPELIALGSALLALVAVRAAVAMRLPARSARSAGRTGKLWTRFLPMAVLALVPCAALRMGGALGVLCASSALVSAAALYAAYRRRGPDRSPCEACAERSQPVCRGFAPIVRRERALQRVAGRWLDAGSAGRGPA